MTVLLDASDHPGPVVRSEPALDHRLAVVFDGDDTLWSTEQLYDEARTAAAGVVASVGLDPERWEAIERRVDVENVAVLGHSADRFPASCVQAYEQLCNEQSHTPDPCVAEAVRGEAESVFERVAPLVPGARETIARLRTRGARVALLTKGEAGVQAGRLRHSGLGDLFDIVEIVPHKSPERIRAVVASLRVEVADAWMVGNSVRSDVLPALAAGLRAVWVDAHVWEYERAYDHLLDDRVITAGSLADVPDLIVARA